MNGPELPDEALFEAALQCRTPAERAAYLDRVCAGPPELRRRFEVLLGAHDRAGAFLEPVTAAVSPSVRLELGREEAPGTVIGRYKLLEKIGEGGVGVVYMAEQTEPIRRRVALKVIKAGMDTKQVVTRFEVERQALALMDHPNIAKVLDAGATDAGRPFFVMELVRGIKITDYCDRNNLSTKERLNVFMQVCHAVQHAHQKGIIHRDIKPSNILVTLHDGVAVPKVIDFGIAKATQQPLTDKTVFTAFQQFIGTPAYMSPEQAGMSPDASGDIDTRSDIYSLGVLLYELLTGKTPFEQKDFLQAGLDEMRRWIREKEPPKPSTRLSTLTKAELSDVAKHRGAEAPRLIPLVRGDLDWIVMRALEKDRRRRYETADGLADDLRRHLTHEPVVARPHSSLYRLRKSVRRNWLAYSAAMAVVLALALGVAFSSWQAVRARRAEKLAGQRSEESEAILKFLAGVFQSPDPARDGRTITVAETLDRAAKKLETDLASQSVRRAQLQATLGSTYYALGLFREAIPLQETVRDYHLANSGREHSDTLSAMHNLAASYLESGRWQEALKMFEEVLRLRRKVNGPEHGDTLKAMTCLANCYHGAGRRDEALKLHEEVLRLGRKVNGPEDPDTLLAMNNLALSYKDASRRDEALKLQEEVVRLRRKVNGPKHPATLLAMNNLANFYFEARRLDEALKLGEEVLGLRREVLGPEHPHTLVAMGNLAISRFEAGRRDEGLKLHEEVLRLLRKVLGPKHPDTLRTMNNLAVSYDIAGRRAEALKLREDARMLTRVEQGRLAEIKDISRGVAPDQGGPSGAKIGEPLQADLERGMAGCLAGNWQEAAASFHQALQQPVFDWDLADHCLPTPDHWIALAFVRAGDYQGHHQLCRQLATVERKTVDPAGGVLRAMLLPANPALELLTLASNALPKSESVLTNEYLLAWFRFHRGLLEYRSGRYADALASARQAAEWRGKFCRVYSLIIQSMASQCLGQEAEARRLCQQAADSIPELRKEPDNLTNTRNLLLIQLFLEEAAALVGLDGQKSLQQKSAAPRNPP